MIRIHIEKFYPEGFAECLHEYTGDVKEAAEAIAARASSYLRNGGTFYVEMADEPKFQDKGVTRPVAYVVADEQASAEEAEHKILGKAVRSG